MRPRFAIALLIANTAWAQGPVEIPFAEVHEHILRSPGIIHSVVTLDRLQPDYVTLQIVVDEAGRVESAKAVAGPKDFFSQAESLESQRHFKPFERNGQPVRAAFEDYVSIMPPESWSDKKVPFPEIKDWSSLKISLERTACYGSCPDYSIEVLGNGNVEFRGNRHVLITGNHRATISQQAIRDLFSVFKAADYFSLKDKYSYAVTDNPTFKTAIEFDGFKKSVVDYVGAHVGMPDVVTDLEMAVDRLAGSEKWVKGNQETGPALIAERWDFRANTEENRTLFSNVVARGTPDLVQLFVSNGTPALGMDKNGAGPLMNAARKGDFDLVKTILHGQGDPPAATMSCTLGAAAHSGNLPLVQFLIEKGAPVDGPPCGQYEKSTVLMQAVESGKADVVQEILKFRQDVNARNIAGLTPLALLARNVPGGPESRKIVDSLLAVGADVNSRDDSGETPLFYACQNGNGDALGQLIKAGADVNTKDRNGSTVLMACFGSASIFKPIIDAGADLSIQNAFGRTAAEEARAMGAIEKADLLEAAAQAKAKK